MNSLIILSFLACCATYAQAELKYLQVVFRHGDRAFRNEVSDPALRGGLTNKGKIRAFALGAHLRKTYGEFLGDTYCKREVIARSTSLDRTKMSLQLVLAALYPPKGKQKWNPALDWQPIPATYVNSLDDNLMIPEECPLYLRARERAEQSHKFKQRLKRLKPFMKQLSWNVGTNITSTNQMYFLYHTLMAEKATGQRLPEWANKCFPNGLLLEGTNLEYKIASYNTKLKRLNGGMFIKRFIDDMLEHQDHDDKRKLNIYSGYDTNIAAILQALGVYKPHVPAYSSAVFIELHKENNKYYVKAKYYKGIPSKHKVLRIPHCGVKCTLKQFRKATRHVYPSDLETICNKRAVLQVLQRNHIQVAPGLLTQIVLAIDNENKELLH